MRILCIFYAERPIFDAFLYEKLWERFSNLSQLLRNLSVSFQDLSVSVATDAPKCTLESFLVIEKVLLPFLNEASQNVKTILHGSLCCASEGKRLFCRHFSERKYDCQIEVLKPNATCNKASLFVCILSCKV